MQSDWKQIYKLTAKRTGKTEQIYKDVGNFVFHALYQQLRRPKSLILKLKGVGQWYLRKRRMDFLIDTYVPEDQKDGMHRLEVIKLENKKEIYEIFQERMKEYLEYIKIKKEIQKKRHETQPLLETTDRKAQSEETSKGDLGQSESSSSGT